MIPDHSYAPLYAETVDHCREHGAFDPATMGTTPNVGLMAQAAEEYGSHDKTFEIAGRRTVRVVDDAGADAARARGRRRRHLADVPDQGRRRSRTGCGSPSRARERPAGRPCSGSTRRGPTTRAAAQGPPGARASSTPTSCRSRSWTWPRRRDSRSSAPAAARDTISVTGNVLRDYLTDLFPILELGTSAKMQSIVPLMNGGGLFETGAGGSAPQHVQQFLEENHLRWDSLGEFLALGPSLELLAEQDRQRARRRCWPTRSIARSAICSRRTARRHATSASSTTAAATSTSPCTGPASSPSRAMTPSWRPAFAPAGRATRRERGDDRRGAGCGSGLAGRHRRLLPPGPREGGGGDAPERDVQRRAWRAVTRLRLRSDADSHA